ncbi:MAG: type IV toxin-antitoxin system AbiEi family antitoxin domain-containing protein [Actinobacteria bacterium]|nr:type IV toxin-antitoxin system AbiEi family antitoxin domain-containing protein [Actinomycetota bacterium]
MQPAASLELRAILARQSGIVSRRQAMRAGVPPTLIDNRLRSGRWMKLHQGVYATFSGHPGREAELWAALLRAGRWAAFSHYTAAELNGLVTEPARLLHITVPLGQRVAPYTGVVLHHSRTFYGTVHPTASPPRIRLEHTVLDLTQNCTSFDDAFAWLCRAVGHRLTTPQLLREALDGRSRVRWRRELSIALGDISEGVHSPLERRYVTNVERPHGLPTAQRQALIQIGGRRRYVDNLYEEAMLAVELDGLVAHPPEQRWADSHRDNELAGAGLLTLHFNWHDINASSCRTAGQVGRLLIMRGTKLTLRQCGPGCTAPAARPPEIGIPHL